MSQLSNRIFLYLTWFVGLSTVGIVLFSSLLHPARADQITYLIQTSFYDNFWDKLSFSLSYNRNMFLSAGDEIFFRPILFLLMSVEEFLFGYQFMYWQAMSLFLHGLVVVSFVQLFPRMIHSVKGCLVLVAFSVSLTTQEMIVWHHLHGYLLALVFILQSLRYFLRILKTDTMSINSDLRKCILWLTLACFSYEFAIIVNLIFIGYFLWKKPQLFHKGCWFILPLMMYFLISILDFSLRSGLTITQEAHQITFTSILKNAFNLFSVYFQTLLAPVFVDLIPALKPYVQLPVFQKFRFLLGAIPFFSWLNILLWGVCLIFIISLFRLKRKEIECDHLLRVSLLIFVGYAGFVLLGRLSERSVQYLLFHLHHLYPLTLFLFLATYAVINRIDSNSLIGKFLIPLLLMLMISLHGFKSYGFNVAMSKGYRWGQYLHQIHSFVRNHHDEPNFSIAIQKGPINRRVQIYFGKAINNDTEIGFVSDYLFHRYINHESPRYVIAYDEITHQIKPIQN